MRADDVLRRQLSTFVERHGGSAAQAADTLQLPRVFVWRYLKTGRAIPRNAAKLQRALDAVASREIPGLAGETPGKSEKKQVKEFRFSRTDIAKMRHMLQYLITVLDAYEEGDSCAVRPSRAGSPY